MRISIIGGGNLGSALVRGFLGAKGWKASDILVCDISRSKGSFLRRKFKVRTTRETRDALNFSSTLILAVKPKDIESLLTKLKKFNNNR